MAQNSEKLLTASWTFSTSNLSDTGIALNKSTNCSSWWDILKIDENPQSREISHDLSHWERHAVPKGEKKTQSLNHGVRDTNLNVLFPSVTLSIKLVMLHWYLQVRLEQAPPSVSLRRPAVRRVSLSLAAETSCWNSCLRSCSPRLCDVVILIRCILVSFHVVPIYQWFNPLLQVCGLKTKKLSH